MPILELREVINFPSLNHIRDGVKFLCGGESRRELAFFESGLLLASAEKIGSLIIFAPILQNYQHRLSWCHHRLMKISSKVCLSSNGWVVVLYKIRAS